MSISIGRMCVSKVKISLIIAELKCPYGRGKDLFRNVTPIADFLLHRRVEIE